MSSSSSSSSSSRSNSKNSAPNLPTNIMDFRGFDSSVILILRGRIPRLVGNFPESLSQAMLIGCNVARESGRTPST